MFAFEFPLSCQGLVGLMKTVIVLLIQEHLTKFFTSSFFPSEVLIVHLTITVIRQS